MDAGEKISTTLRLEFQEEAGNFTGEKKERFLKAADLLFARGGELVYVHRICG